MVYSGSLCFAVAIICRLQSFACLPGLPTQTFAMHKMLQKTNILAIGLCTVTKSECTISSTFLITFFFRQPQTQRRRLNAIHSLVIVHINTGDVSQQNKRLSSNVIGSECVMVIECEMKACAISFAKIFCYATVGKKKGGLLHVCNMLRQNY